MINFSKLWKKICQKVKSFQSPDISRLYIKDRKTKEKGNCQALSISQSLNFSLSLRDRDRADTIIQRGIHIKNDD